MHNVTLTSLLDYMMMYCVIFFICLVGALVRDIFDTIVNLTHINIKKILISVIFTSMILKVVLSLIDMSIEVYVFVCFFSGVWSFKILELAMNWKVISVLVKNILKNSKTTLGKSVADTIDELNDDKKDSDKKPADEDTAQEDDEKTQ